MNGNFMRVALRQIGGWLLLIFFVGLLSTIFSFLGTLFCAALAGMMLGAMRQARWQAVPVSVVFPAVIFTLLRSSKVDLSSTQIRMLAVLCFGTFWLVYVIAFALMRFESKGQTAERALVANRRPREALATRSSKQVVAAAANLAGTAGLSLETLQGRWLWNSKTAEAHIREKVMEVQKEQMVVSVTDDQGRLTFRANARLRLETVGPLHKLVISTEPDSPSDVLVSI